MNHCDWPKDRADDEQYLATNGREVSLLANHHQVTLQPSTEAKEPC
ncbi:hypothetical protein [Enterococcus sp. DIV0212c]|nr:hypothetical protein [Enterococcus sp. DIV0212c]MBO1353053.1 hypothetical protein [Enterococcus sp. DIV0212c]